MLILTTLSGARLACVADDISAILEIPAKKTKSEGIEKTIPAHCEIAIGTNRVPIALTFDDFYQVYNEALVQDAGVTIDTGVGEPDMN